MSKVGRLCPITSTIHTINFSKKRRRAPKLLKILLTALEYIQTAFLYLSHAADIDKPTMATLLKQTSLTEGDNIMATLAEQWKEEGMQQGIEKGIKKGIKKGEIKANKEVVTKLLSLKFGELDELTTKKIESATLEELTQWSERILFAETIEDVFK